MLNTVSIKPILLTDADNAVDTTMTMDTANAVLVSALAAIEGDEPVVVRILETPNAVDLFKR